MSERQAQSRGPLPPHRFLKGESKRPVAAPRHRCAGCLCLWWPRITASGDRAASGLPPGPDQGLARPCLTTEGHAAGFSVAWARLGRGWGREKREASGPAHYHQGPRRCNLEGCCTSYCPTGEAFQSCLRLWACPCPLSASLHLSLHCPGWWHSHQEKRWGGEV